MPALNFQKRFAPDVKSGAKGQTIRAHRKDGRAHCQPGDTLALYTGMRTTQCRKLGEGKVSRVSEFKITIQQVISINGGRLTAGEGKNQFARADGFVDAREMLEWFQKTHGLPFDGVVIEWELLP